MLPSKSWRAYPQTYRLEAGRCKKCGKTYSSAAADLLASAMGASSRRSE